MSRLPAPDWGSLLGRSRSGRPVLWRLCQVLIVLAVARACWILFGGLPHEFPYLIDADVYRMGGQAWLEGRPLYADASGRWRPYATHLQPLVDALHEAGMIDAQGRCTA